MMHESMVHALEEIWRVLVPDGVLIDLRPHGEDVQIAVVTGDAVHPAGKVDVSAGIVDDYAADAAMETIVERGLFRREQRHWFELLTYWDSFSDFETYVDRLKNSVVPAETMANLETLFATHAPNAHIRVRYNMLIGKYRKHSG